MKPLKNHYQWLVRAFIVDARYSLRSPIFLSSWLSIILFLHSLAIIGVVCIAMVITCICLLCTRWFPFIPLRVGDKRQQTDGTSDKDVSHH